MAYKRYFYLYIVMVTTLAAAAQKVPDPCSLLSAQEVEEVMQVPMKPGRLRDGRGSFSGLSCTYFSQNQFEQSGSVKIIIDTTADMQENGHIYPSAKAMYEKQKQAYVQALKRQNRSSEFQPVKGVGEDAFWDGSFLKAVSGDTYLAVSVSGGGKTDGASEKYSRSSTIARRILQRLKE